MTLQAAIDALEALIDLDLDLNVGSSPTDQQLCDCLSDSARRLYQDLDYEFHTVGFDPVAGDQEFPLIDDDLNNTPQIDNPLFHVDEVRINDVPIVKMSWERFKAAFPTWRTADNGTPVAFCVTPDLTLVFNCPFSVSCIAEGGFGITGRGCPARFDAAAVTGEFDCHPLLQWAVIRNAVPYSTDAYIDSTQAFNRLRLYDDLAERDRKRFDDLQADHSSPLDDMPTTFGCVL